ncbi:MAG TPA: hypothetical protein VEU30_11680 [Thermoanaerobaculia bacterium]|nr:hypothetical protein [Thermoanaerobaculia bacterium]
MREIDFTGGQEIMEKMIVDTTPHAVERLSVFRATPFEIDVTATALASTAVIGRPMLIDTRTSGAVTERSESWSAPLSTDASTHRR